MVFLVPLIAVLLALLARKVFKTSNERHVSLRLFRL